MADVFAEAHAAMTAVMNFYKAHGCPCGYPRFWQMVNFNFRAFGTAPVGSHIQQLLISIAAMAEGAFYVAKGEWQGQAKEFECPVCKTKVFVIDEEFSINMRFMRMEPGEKILARARGLAPGKIPVPAGGGLFGLGSGAIEKIRAAMIVEGTFEELTAYLTAMDLTWPPVVRK